jgi:membrane protein implicated in regulation of membrane protease activity
MNEEPRRLTFQGGGSNWLQRVLVTSVLAVLGAALLVLMVFFLTVALAAGAILAAIIALRLWWVGRRVRAQRRRDEPLEGEYRVVHRDDEQHRR